MSGYLKVELLHGAIARDQRQKDTLRGLGLRRRHQQRVLQDTPSIRGMIQKVFDLVRFEKTQDKALPVKAKVETYRLGPVPPPSEAAKKTKKAKTPAKKSELKATKVKTQKSKAPAKKK